jgi:tRNA (guanine-N7-)-methyltransferase
MMQPPMRLQDENSAPAMEPAAWSGLHGRRKGKALRAQQADLVATLLPQLALDLSKPLSDPQGLFAAPVSDIWLEIGFGGGEHLIDEARRNPECGFIGCEPFVNGMAKALSAIADGVMSNIRLHCDDATDVIAALPPACLGGAYLLYPDPWPKWRQRKRRFLTDAKLAALARVMRAGAELRFATDIDDNAGWTLARVLRSPDFDWSPTSASAWQKPWAHWAGTRYEAKALAAGRRPAYLTFTRR